MAIESLSSVRYEEREGDVSWLGIQIDSGEAFTEFMAKQVASRLYDSDGRAEVEVILRGVANTGFSRDSLETVLAAGVPEERDWSVGEAIAEAYLECELGVIWPWNMERDKRNPKASLQGADLVGFKVEDNGVRLAFGEVKTSTDKDTPPRVMRGSSGMPNQIESLSSNLSLIFQLLCWLSPRCKGTDYEALFKQATGQFFESGNKAIALFGVLTRLL